MPEYRYEAFDQRGARHTGKLGAASKRDVVSLLDRQNLIASSVVETTHSLESSQLFNFGSRPIASHLKHYMQFTRELASLVEARVPLDQALHLISQQPRVGAIKRQTIAIARAVEQGMGLSEAIAQNARGAPAILAPLVAAGERRGQLAPALTEAAVVLERRYQTENRLRSALIYPLVLTIASFGAISIIVLYLVPALMPLFRENNVPPPPVLAGLEVVAQFFYVHWTSVLMALTAGLLILRAVLATSWGGLQQARLTLAIPGVGQLIREINASAFARTLAALVQSKVAMPEALQTAATVLPNRAIAHSATSVSIRVQEGLSLSQALAQHGQFPELLTTMVRIGEETGELARMLDHYATSSDEAIVRQSENLMTLLGPTLTIAIGVFVGWLVLSVVQALLRLNELAL